LLSITFHVQENPVNENGKSLHGILSGVHPCRTPQPTTPRAFHLTTLLWQIATFARPDQTSKSSAHFYRPEASFRVQPEKHTTNISGVVAAISATQLVMPTSAYMGCFHVIPVPKRCTFCTPTEIVVL